MINFLIILIILFFLGIYLQKKNFLVDNTGFSKHKSFVKSSKKIPVTGGLFLLLTFIFFNLINLDFIYSCLLLLIFSIGFFSDLSNNFSPKIRFIIQIFITLIFILNTQNFVTDTRIEFINNLFLNYKFISIFFTLFCILVLINGTNFIDGINLSVTGYYLLIFISLFYLTSQHEIIIDKNILNNLIKITLALFIINSLNKTQLGDGGAYLIAFITGFMIIDFINLNKIASPYFAINLLWYPCLENLFSIFRKILIKKDISRPDNHHLHHLIYLYLKQKKIKFPNNFSGIFILLFNCLAITMSTLYFQNTINQLQILLMCILVYIFSYFVLKKKLKIKL